ncbi:prepilin-type N-terminal cleavage/methylation domain-containing protein [Opitutaceae bacterium TAV1]|nr:prepilin-type N-terminal cleavage/methylation domain-containing protein [Opitutaceae bacterium TAV1]
MKKHLHLPPRAFTLIELLTVIAIIGILAAIIIPTVGRVRQSARSAQCVSHLRQLGTAFNLFADENKGMFPMRYNYGSRQTNPNYDKTWMMQLAPYIGIPEGRIGVKIDEVKNVGVLICPAWRWPDLNPPATERYQPYAYNSQINQPGDVTALAYQRSAIATPSKNFLVIECDRNGETALANEVERRHPGDRANYLFVDGHIESIQGVIPGSDPRFKLSN